MIQSSFALIVVDCYSECNRRICNTVFDTQTLLSTLANIRSHHTYAIALLANRYGWLRTRLSRVQRPLPGHRCCLAPLPHRTYNRQTTLLVARPCNQWHSCSGPSIRIRIKFQSCSPVACFSSDVLHLHLPTTERR